MSDTIEKSDVVIIGGVACGPKTGATLARRMPNARITLFQKETRVSYGTCGMPYFASGDVGSFLELTTTSYDVPRTPEFFKSTKGFDVVTEAEVTAIDRERKVVTVKMLATGETIEHGYGKLVLATGAVPNKPPFPVPASEKVRAFTRPEDAINFRQAAQTGEVGKAVIIGGGFIGCEMAEATASLWGIETTLIERESQLLPYVLDADMARIVRTEMERQEVTVITDAAVEKIELNAEGNPVVSVQGQDPITADYVFLCMGVHPLVDLAKDCGLEIGGTGAIAVNSRMQTSDEDIYAGGDCVENHNVITGRNVFMPMGSLANRHGRVIAENIAGNPVEFPGVVGAFFAKVFDVNVGTTGLSETAAERVGLKATADWGAFTDKPEFYPEAAGFVLKMVYDPTGGKIYGLQAVGKGDVCRRVDVFSLLLQRQGTLDDLLDFEHGYAPPYSEALDPLHHMAGVAQARRSGIDFVSPLSGVNPNPIGECTWLDVREPAEMENSPWTAPDGRGGVVKIPLDDLKDRINELDPSKKMVIVCRRGPRSYQAALILKTAGFKDVHVLGGGTTAAMP